MNQMASGAHDSVINDYLRRISGFEGLSEHDALLKHRSLGFALAREIESLGGDSFLVEDGAGSLGIAVTGPEIGLAVTGLSEDHKVVAVRTFGRLSHPVVEKTSALDDGDFTTPYRLAIEHRLLPAGRIVHEARNREKLDVAFDAFTNSFEP